MSTIQVSDEVKDRLREYGKMGDTYETAIIRVLDRLEELEEVVRKSRSENPREAFATV